MPKAKFVGQPKTRQYEGRWLEPDDVLDVPQATHEALCELPDFESESKVEKKTKKTKTKKGQG